MSEHIKDGGPAFPVHPQAHEVGDAAYAVLAGMTLRDYFAAKALAGLLADIPKSMYGLDWQRQVVGASYDIADLMLACREVTP